MKSEKTKKYFKYSLSEFKWLFFIEVSLVIGSVMAFGLVAYISGAFERISPISMLGMIIPMLIIIVVDVTIISSASKKKMMKIIDGFDKVKSGDFDYQIEFKKNDEFKLVYEDFNKMVAQLNESKKESVNFTNNLTHEFKTPLTSIQGFSELLYNTGDGIESEERMQYLKVIKDQSSRLATLTQNMLLLSKFESYEIIPDKENFNLGELIRRDVIMLLPKIEEKNIELNIDLPDIDFYGNSEIMEQVWINLINNAIKFTSKNGEITVKASVTDDNVTVEVSDNGIGMDKKTKERIFDKYFQGSKSSQDGNGIGLSIVKRIVDLCDGKIEVKSEKDNGTSFFVSLKRNLE